MSDAPIRYVCRKVQNRTDENPMKPASKLRANQREHGLAGWRQSGRPATQSRVSCHAVPYCTALCCAVRCHLGGSVASLDR